MQASLDASCSSVPLSLVREQLRLLGYTDVPDDVLQEFLHDLLLEEAPEPAHDEPAARAPVVAAGSRKAPLQRPSTAPSRRVPKTSPSTDGVSMRTHEKDDTTFRRPSTRYSADGGVTTENSQVSVNSEFSTSQRSRSSGVIWSKNSRVSTPRRTDNVAKYQEVKSKWSQDGFLNKTSKRPTTSSGNSRRKPFDHLDRRNNLQNVEHHQQHPIVPEKYVVPTEKRRDNLRMQIRKDMSKCTHIPPAKTPRLPNDYVPPTQKRRDALRWNMREQMTV